MSLENKVNSKSVSLWHNQNYLILWSGQVVSSVGSQISLFAFPLLILTLTHSPAQAGFAGALRLLPYLIFSLPAGAIIDRLNRKHIMIICDTGRAIIMASILFALSVGHLYLIQIYIVTIIEGTLFVFFNIAQIASLPRVVLKEQLPTAIAQNSFSLKLSYLLGPPLGGALYSLRQALPFLADAISYGISVLSLFFIKATFQEERAATQRKLGAEIKEGFMWLWHHPVIRYMAILVSGSNLITSGFTLIVIVIGQHLRASSFAIGLVFTIGGLGGILGAIVAASIKKRFSFGQVIISEVWLEALFWSLFAAAPNLTIVGIILAMNFFIGPIFDVVQQSYRMASIPDELQGRVNSIFRLIVFTSQPLGLSLTGVLLQTIGVIPTILVFGGWLIILAVITTLNPNVRNAHSYK